MTRESTAADSATATSEGTVYGALCWVSLMTRDLEAAHDFYGAVMGWRFRPARLGKGFSVALSGGRVIAGMGALASEFHVAVAWTPYFAVRNADVTAGRIRERSGTVAVGPVAFALGRGALAADRDGAVFGIWEGELPTGWGQWRSTAPAWVRLHTRDAFEAAIFYGEVLDWACGRPGHCDVEYEGDEVVLRSAGRAVARLSSGALEAAPDPAIRPRWQVHFPVPDIEARVAAAQRHGGTVVSHEPGVQATLRDPDGALFTLTDAGTAELTRADPEAAELTRADPEAAERTRAVPGPTDVSAEAGTVEPPD
ncbi:MULTISPECIES: VOC family protein [Streptomyces]|uniref:VOC family protein n=1 Tax=Streptomyces sudanensis TaxID=436397 RepID=A0ABY4THN4_9ACTN|nr:MULTISPECIES: VOC family protein [Streptomyces]URN18417.1 VOC family protein [Streptomyces sudanensis]